MSCFRTRKLLRAAKFWRVPFKKTEHATEPEHAILTLPPETWSDSRSYSIRNFSLKLSPLRMCEPQNGPCWWLSVYNVKLKLVNYVLLWANVQRVRLLGASSNKFLSIRSLKLLLVMSSYTHWLKEYFSCSLPSTNSFGLVLLYRYCPSSSH